MGPIALLIVRINTVMFYKDFRFLYKILKFKNLGIV